MYLGTCQECLCQLFLYVAFVTYTGKACQYIPEVYVNLDCLYV